jgi:hypothetical protein
MSSPGVARRSKPPCGVAGFPWNQWQLSPGIGGSFAMESVATFVWNRWQLCYGISGSFPVESVAGLAWNTQQEQMQKRWEGWAELFYFATVDYSLVYDAPQPLFMWFVSYRGFMSTFGDS